MARHDLIDDIPSEFDIAIPRGSWTPDTTVPVRWRQFDPETFEIGRALIDIGGQRSIGMYFAECSSIDAFRMRHLDGADLANEALKCWLGRGGQPSELHGAAIPTDAEIITGDIGDPVVSRVSWGTPSGGAYLALKSQAQRTVMVS